MIAFASLFLGLVFGSQPVALVVGADVDRVAIYLDGALVGSIGGTPWILETDFGESLQPHLLEAVAYDRDGNEIGRVHQFINLPQPRAAISVVIERGPPRVALISWESAAGAEPESLDLSLDGQSLEVGDLHRVVLPPVDEKTLHLLQVEMKFQGRTSSRVDMTFGGEYIDEVSTEITALPITAIGSSKKTPTIQSVRGWFLESGKPLRVIAVEKDIAEIVVVLGRTFPHLLEPRSRRKRPKSLILDSSHRLRFVFPYPETSKGVSTTFELFPVTPPYRAIGDLYSMLSNMGQPAHDSAPLIGSAVAVAGLKAYESRQRRAVVLIPSSREHPTTNDISADRVRSYLATLRVPLVVWEPESNSSPSARAWGEIESVGSLDNLGAAFQELSELLDRQWIVWLDGQHLPHEITLSPEVTGFDLR